jgi:hypothetical protein
MALFDALKDLSSTWLLTGNGRMFKSLDPPELREVLLDIIGSNQSIQRIVVMLKGLNDEDLEGVLHQVMERKRLRELHSELRSMMNKLERPAAAVEDERQKEQAAMPRHGDQG